MSHWPLVKFSCPAEGSHSSVPQNASVHHDGTYTAGPRGLDAEASILFHSQSGGANEAPFESVQAQHRIRGACRPRYHHTSVSLRRVPSKDSVPRARVQTMLTFWRLASTAPPWAKDSRSPSLRCLSSSVPPRFRRGDVRRARAKHPHERCPATALAATVCGMKYFGAGP